MGDIAHRMAEQVDQLAQDRIDRNAQIAKLEGALRDIVGADPDVASTRSLMRRAQRALDAVGPKGER